MQLFIEQDKFGTPIFQDDCQHGHSTFAGSCIEEMNHRQVDVYVYGDWKNPSFLSGGVCLRYGDDGPEYVSPILQDGLAGIRKSYGEAVANLVESMPIPH